MWPVRLSVRTPGFQPGKTSSILVRATKILTYPIVKLWYLDFSVCENCFQRNYSKKYFGIICIRNHCEFVKIDMYFTHSGNTDLSEVKKKKSSTYPNISEKDKDMLKKIYKAMVLSRAASAANETLRTLSDSQLDDIGLSRASFVSEIVNSVRKDLDNAEIYKSKRKMIATLINPNLAGSV